MNRWYKVLENIVWVTQLGLSMLLPPIVCLWFCQWLTAEKGVGGWVFVPGIALGLGAGAVGFRDFARMWMRRVEKEKKDHPTPGGFNQH